MNSLYPNKYERVLSNRPTFSIRGRQVQLDSNVIILPYHGVNDEKNEHIYEKHLLLETASALRSDETRIVMEELASTAKIHRIKALFRHTIPDFITCRQLWSVIKISILIVLLLLYYTQVVLFSADAIAICELIFSIPVMNENFIGFLHYFVGWIPFLNYEFHRAVHCIDDFHGSATLTAFFWFTVSLMFERNDYFKVRHFSNLNFLCTSLPKKGRSNLIERHKKEQCYLEKFFFIFYFEINYKVYKAKDRLQ